MAYKIIRSFIILVILYVPVANNQRSTAQPTYSNNYYLPILLHDHNPWIGPFGGYLVAIAVDPSNPLIIYAGSWGSGVYKSQDGGQNWKPVNNGLGNLYINSLALDKSNPSTLYAGTYKYQVYKSLDGGNSWFWSGTGMQEQAIVYTIAIDPIEPSILYAGTRGVSNNGNPPWKGIVYKSINAGGDWSPVLMNIGGADAQDWVYSLEVSPHDHHYVFAASHEHGPYRTYNSGSSWQKLEAGIIDYSGRAIIISPDYSEDMILYYGVWHVDAVYKSLTAGLDWFTVNRDIVYTKVYSMAIDPIHPNNVYLATFTRGVMKTENDGSNWKEAGLQGTKIYNIAIDPTSPANLYAGTAGDGLYKSQDGGLSWQYTSNGINNSMPTKVILSISVPNKLYTSMYGSGVYQSGDRGKTWIAINAGLIDKFVHALVQDPAHPETFYALTNTGGLFKNDFNNGAGWVAAGLGLPLTFSQQPPFPADHPFAAHDIQDSIFSTNANSNDYEIMSVSLLAMKFAPSDPQVAYIGTAGSGVYKSTNNGTSWQPAGLAGESIQSIAVDYFNPYLVYAATSAPGSLKVSLNGAQSWIDVNLPVTFYSLLTTPNAPGLLYAGTNSGIYSYQSGTWTLMGLADKAVTSIATDPYQLQRIYAGTTSGAYYTNDGGFSWEIIDPNLNGLVIQSIDVDPANPNQIYLSTKTHGIYLAEIDH